MTKVSDALEDWRRARRELETATPWTAAWTRARMIEQDRRAAYQALIDEYDEETTEVAPDAFGASRNRSAVRADLSQ